MNIREKILSPFQLGQVKLNNRLLMAPMAEVTNAITRKQMRQFGAAGCVSEMINVTGLKYNKDQRYLLIDPDEHPVGIQLYGKHLVDFAPAAKFISEQTTADWLDLNFGCPAPKVTANGGGSAMMKDPLLVKAVIQETISVTSLPLTVKFRLGWSNEQITIKECANYAVQLGVAAITLHPRTRSEKFGGHSHWEYLKQLKEDFPETIIIGSGDLWTPEDVLQMFSQTNCDAVMLARGAFGNPWLFKQVIEFCQTGQYCQPTKAQRIAVYLQHLKDYIPLKASGERNAVCEMRKFAARYLREFEGAVELRSNINKLETLSAIENLLKK